MLEKSLEAR
jgi:hypothetical protein